ncbi:nucleoside/nucleotide kinase family protein [Ornithinimicrobium sufpigmenti]|uniref:nucleoside/nucleotide kinase family protein n=1 Tax=Ornithinimicrobium sufpigmenti TaxID=2508882 RepID=UPI001035E17F|nr:MULTISPECIES: nucleoside/nucleotide kinase family protein [unclassified Ornithinimicrobium]
MTSLTAPDGPRGADSADSLPDLVADARALAGRGRRTILGLTGAPGAGKSTLAAALADTLGPELVAVVPMDGFHLSNEILHARGARGRKGAIDTFDDAGYAALLTRLRDQGPDEIVYAPTYDRDLETAIGSALPVLPTVPLVLTEGNYLLSPDGAWPLARAAMDEVWFVDLDATAREARLIQRHVRHGEDPTRARDRALGPDRTNALAVEALRGRATRVVRMTS